MAHPPRRRRRRVSGGTPWKRGDASGTLTMVASHEFPHGKMVKNGVVEVATMVKFSNMGFLEMFFC